MRRAAASLALILLVGAGLVGVGSGRPAVAAVAPPGLFYHVVEEGDSLGWIALRYGVALQAVLGANGLTTRSIIYPGQRIAVPLTGGAFHTTVAGDSLWSLAKTYGSTIEAIKQANGLVGDTIWIGRRLLVPRAVGGQGPASSVASFGGAGRAESTGAGGGAGVAGGGAGSGVTLSTAPGELIWPAYGGITSLFTWRWGRMHTGIDIAAPHGSAIRAAADGVVTYAGWLSGYGRAVTIRHADGKTTLYAHASTLLVATGERVTQGQIVARVGSTGYSTGPHLHFEVIVGGTPQDPLDYLATR